MHYFAFWCGGSFHFWFSPHDSCISLQSRCQCPCLVATCNQLSRGSRWFSATLPCNTFKFIYICYISKTCNKFLRVYLKLLCEYPRNIVASKPINNKDLAKNFTAGNLVCFTQDCFAFMKKQNSDCVNESCRSKCWQACLAYHFSRKAYWN